MALKFNPFTGNFDLVGSSTGGGAVDSVNGQTGVVVLDADDIDDAATTQKFVTAADLTTLSNTSGTNTGDQDLSGLVPYSGATGNVDIGANSYKGAGINDSTDVSVLNINGRQLLDDVGSQVAGWGAGESYGFHVYGGLQVDNIFNASSPYVDFGSGGDCSILTRALVDGSNLDGVDPKNRRLYANNGSTIALDWSDPSTLTATTITVSDDPYSASWDDSTQVPTKNAIYDKIESLGPGGSFSMTEAEIDFGTTPQWSKTFTVTDALVSGTSKVSAWASGNTATGRVGNDDEWDMVMYSAKAGTGEFTLTAMALPGPIVGKRKIFYAIG